MALPTSVPNLKQDNQGIIKELEFDMLKFRLSEFRDSLYLKEIKDFCFILKRRAIQLYKEFFRVTRQIPNKSEREEVRAWIRTDFKNNKKLTSEYAIKLSLLSGERSLRELQANIALAK